MSARLRNALSLGLTCLALVCASYAIFGIHVGPLPRPPAPLEVDEPFTESDDPLANPPSPVVVATHAPPAVGLLSEPRPFRLPSSPESTSESPGLTTEQVQAAVRSSVVCITRVEETGETSVSGVLIGNTGHVLTTAAGLATATGVFASVPNRWTVPAEVVLTDEQGGIAVLRAPLAPGGEPTALDPVGVMGPGASLVMLACASGIGIATKSVTASPPASAEPDRVSLGESLTPGSAGGGVFDRRGRLVGLVVDAGDETAPAHAVSMARVIDQLIRGQPTTPVFGLVAADYLRIGVAHPNPERAMWAFRMALVLEPGAMLTRYNLGVAAARLRAGHATAAAAYRQVIRRDPTFTDAYVNLALVLLDGGDPGGAVRALESLTVLEPEAAEAWSTLGEAYRRLGMPTQAETALQRAVEINPVGVRAHYNLGVLYATAMDRPRAARSAFLRFAQLAPGTPAAATAMAYVRGGPPASRTPVAAELPDTKTATDNAAESDDEARDGTGRTTERSG